MKKFFNFYTSSTIGRGRHNAGAGQISRSNRDSVFSLRGEEAGQADGPEAAIRGPSKSAQHWHCASYVRRRDG